LLQPSFLRRIARFGVPSKITTDQGRKFESQLFKELCELLGIKYLRMAVYHPVSNGMVEHLHRSCHRQLKAAIKCHDTSNWVERLLIVLLGIRTASKENLNATRGEMIYGAGLRLPGEFFVSTVRQETFEYANRLKERIEEINTLAYNHEIRRKGFVP
jgi:transposase InsO family protein